ncbi:DUF1173 family protein [Aquincola sp. S2]|uniref:DUF1173 family protein n=1 Tax=Pseudaquabacterium terrae TaxID=2732868 RepID=A0ABX2ETG8_9BURK|nr:DUF1173 family protein [Aquabacterium terrae]
MDDSPSALYRIGDAALRAGHDRWQQVLEDAYARGLQPLCLCRPAGVPMYLARYDAAVIKRMPDTGHLHHPACPSFDPPPALSGLGEVLGEAVVERAPDRVDVLLDFPLTRRPGCAAPAGGGGAEATEAVAQRRRLGLRGLVHLLLQRAGFNRWVPRMQGKRTWFVVRKHLIEAAAEIHAKGMRLADCLFIPEPYSIDKGPELARRRTQVLARLQCPDQDAQFRLMLVMSELKEFTATEVDYRIVLRHMPDCPLYMQRKAGDRFKAIFEREYEAWAHQRCAEQAGQVDPWRSRFLFCGLIYARREDLYAVDMATLVMASSNWLPLDHPYERLLIDELVRHERRFLKPLRFEAKRGASFPNAVLLDTGNSETPLDVVTPFMPERERQAKLAAIAKRLPKAWVWDMQADPSPPPLPAKA